MNPRFRVYVTPLLYGCSFRWTATGFWDIKNYENQIIAMKGWRNTRNFMAKVIQLHIWMQNKKGTWVENEVQHKQPSTGKMVPHPGKRIVLDVETDNINAMKIACADAIKKYIKQLKFYYVVAVVQREDSTLGYRTIVPKVVL